MNYSVIQSFSGDFDWLSNFYLCPVKFEGHIYPSSEHAYQAAKVPDNGRYLFKQPGMSCGDAKRLGRRIKAREDWHTYRIHAMAAILLDKFTRNPSLARRLVDTGDVLLVEGNHWGDCYWGVYKGVGENNLGHLLMDLRGQLQGLCNIFNDGNTRVS